MFICSICQESFLQDDNTVYTTPCGHIFHHQCLIPWINCHKNCPQCRSKVLEKQLTKLYFEIDPAIDLMWNNQAEEELNALRNELELKTLQNQDNLNASSSDIEAEFEQLKHTQHAIKKNNKVLKFKVNNYKFKINELGNRLESLNVNYNLLKNAKTIVENKLLLKQKDNRAIVKNLYGLQSQNSVIIEKLKFKIANLKEKTVDYSNRHHSKIENDNNLPNTSKESIENYTATSYQFQIGGHDPKSKSSKNFLFGCVFLIVEDRYWFEYMCNDVSKSQQNIIKFGGSIAQSYSSHVTHLICITQKNPTVQRGIKDRKRCVTDYWLCDVIAEKKMAAPWLAHHFPAPYNEEIGLPCYQFKIAVVNFDVNKYHLVKTMVEYTGGQVVDDVSPCTNVVVSLTSVNELVERALALNIPVVNVKWLSDIIFGAQVGLLNPHNTIYQQFDLRDPYSVTYNMVSHLMEAWKTPILKRQQVYGFTKNDSSGPLKRCRPEITAENTELNIQIDEDE